MARPQLPIPTAIPATSSTVWPEPMSGRRTGESASPAPKPSLPGGSAEIAPASLELLHRLEESLQASQRALLSRDLALIEQSTCEQIRVRAALEMLWATKANEQASHAAEDEAEFASELRQALQRVLRDGRIQIALVNRAQRRMRTIENVLAGPGGNYSVPQPEQMVGCASYRPATTIGTDSFGPEHGKGNPCRA